jgi:GGDEF domain-containing protein
MRQPILAGGIASDVGVSIGGIWSQQKSALEELLADADALLYQVKGEGKDSLRFSAYGKR